MTPIEQAEQMLKEYEFTIDNYACVGLSSRFVFDLKHEVLIDTCTEIIKVCERLNTYEISFWDNVREELRTKLHNFNP